MIAACPVKANPSIKPAHRPIHPPSPVFDTRVPPREVSVPRRLNSIAAGARRCDFSPDRGGVRPGSNQLVR
jgi:hypothetical protein